jgi:hypothetical protein
MVINQKKKTIPGLSIPQDFPLDKLVGQELINLSIGKYYLSLFFSGQDRVDIEAGFEYKTALGQFINAKNADLATPAAYLVPLLGQCITAVHRLPNNELRLEFGEPRTLTLNVDDQGYEAYHLYVAGQYIDITKEC